MPNTREKLIELLGNMHCGDIGIDGCDSCKYGCETQCNACAFADHLIANGVTFAEDNNVPIKWIPVTERLPESGAGKVLVVKNYRGRSYIDIGEIIEGKAYCYSDEYLVNPREHKLTHWMPLPEPPKGE